MRETVASSTVTAVAAVRPKEISQEVAHDPARPERSSAGVGGVTTYSEGLDIGYRHFEATGQTPLFPFRCGQLSPAADDSAPCHRSEATASVYHQ